MQAGITTEYTVVAIGVDLHVELLAKLYEVLGIFHAILEVDVIIRHAMYQQQIAMQIIGTGAATATPALNTGVPSLILIMVIYPP